MKLQEADAKSLLVAQGLPVPAWAVAHTAAVTVIASGAELADAASTALFVAGPGSWLEVAGRLGIAAALRVDASGRIEMTPAMRDRFEAGTSGDSAIIAVVD